MRIRCATPCSSKGVAWLSKCQLTFTFEEVKVGYYFADLIVNEIVIVEIKACERLAVAHETQLQNYLRATPVEVGLLLNFGEKPEFKRKVFSDDRKNITRRL